MFDFLFTNTRERRFKENGLKIVGIFTNGIPEGNFKMKNKIYEYTGPYISNHCINKGTLVGRQAKIIYNGDILRVDGSFFYHGQGRLELNYQTITGTFDMSNYGEVKIEDVYGNVLETKFFNGKITKFSYLTKTKDKIIGESVEKYSEYRYKCIGSIETHDGDIFEGTFSIDFFCLPSCYISGNLGLKNGVIMNGTWNRKYDANIRKIEEFNGKILYPNGDTYEGLMIQNKFKTGKFIRNGSQYEGEWEYEGNDVKFNGMVLYPNKTIFYTGEMLNYRRNGVGTLVEKSNGTNTYCYCWVNDIKNGEGYISNSNGKSYLMWNNDVSVQHQIN